ncbi:MAG: hypothetical protein KatS3mg009_0516 [Acidimicrobiia bacterium]|nr:MAG: hypothetical protein KatS3mg009_0516 [Acidimicrobiia bacterium]
MLWDLLWFALAFAVAFLVYLTGAAVIRNFARAEPPEEPEPAELADVDYRYQCVVCGAQAVVYAAPEGEVPEAPRHCREPMRLIAPTSD